MSGHVAPVKTYVLTFAALIVLTALTTALGFVQLGRMNAVAAMLIAVTKMMLVALFFMHALYDKGLTRLVIVTGLFWLALLIGLTGADVFSRGWEPAPQGWGPAISAAPALLPRATPAQSPVPQNLATQSPSPTTAAPQNR